MADASVSINIGLQGGKAVLVGLDDIGAAASKLKTMLLGVGTALAGAAGLGVLGQAAINTAKLGGQLADLSARTGMSARSLVTLRQAFNDTGIGADSVGRVMSHLERSIYDAVTAGGAASKSFQDIGLSAEKLYQLSPEEQFREIAKAFGAMTDPAAKTAAAMQIFGKGDSELLPLFGDSGALAKADQVLGKMPDVLARNVPILDDISDSFDRLPQKATQLFAGIFDQLGPTVKAILDAFEGIDFTGAGQKLGAFVNVAIDAFKQGRFGDLIALTIRAAGEVGMEYLGKSFSALRDWLSNGQFWMSVMNAMATQYLTNIKNMSAMILSLTVPFAAVADWVGDAFMTSFSWALNKFIAGLEKAINAAGTFFNETFGTSLGSVSIGKSGLGAQAPDFARSWDLAKKGASAGVEFSNSFFDSMTGAVNDFWGNKPFTAPNGAREELASLVNGQLDRREAAAKSSGGTPAATGPKVIPQNTKLEMQKLELGLSQQLSVITAERGRVEADWTLTNNQKREAKLGLMRQEKGLIDAQITAMDTLRVKASEEEKLSIDQKLVGLRSQSTGMDNQMLGLGADPNSFSAQWTQAITDLQNNFLTLAQTTANAFKDAFGAATSSISSGIQGLIMGTLTWGQALRNIGLSVVNSIVKSFSDMVANWIMSHVIMQGVSSAWSAFQSALRAKDVVEANATELAKTPALSMNAILASIGSFGVAAIVGVAAIAGILAATGAFKNGGYTGDGDPNAVAGIVHRGEYVVPSDAVDRIGIGTLEAISAGGMGSDSGATSSTAPGPVTINMGFFDDPRRMNDWAKSSDGRTVLVDLFRQHAHEFRA